MARGKLELERRRAATERTRAKYIGKSFKWERWRHCIAMARYQAVQLGHRPPPIRPIRSALSAKKELKRRGFASATELLDSLYPRIAPAQMWLGDLAAVKGPDGLDAILINVGPGRLMGWREDHLHELAVLAVSLDEIDAAWRL